MRTLVIFLSLVLFFLTGLIIGVDRSNQENGDHAHVDEAAEQTAEIEENQVIIEQHEEGEGVNELEKPEHFTQKTASFLESGVKGFYELVVGVTYQLVQVFF